MLDLLILPADAEKLLAQRVRAARKRRGWTQAELAERAGIGVATVARLEAKGTAQLSSFLRVLTALGHLRDVEHLLLEPEPTSLAELRARS